MQKDLNLSPASRPDVFRALHSVGELGRSRAAGIPGVLENRRGENVWEIRRRFEIHPDFVAIVIEDEIAFRVLGVSDAAIEVAKVDVNRHYWSIDVGGAVIVRRIPHRIRVPVIVENTIRGAVVQESWSEIVVVPVDERVDVGHTVACVRLAIS